MLVQLVSLVRTRGVMNVEYDFGIGARYNPQPNQKRENMSHGNHLDSREKLLTTL